MQSLKVPAECPNCGNSIAIQVKEMVPGKSRNCPKCACVIRFTGDDGRKVQKSLDDFEKTIKSLGSQKITLKL